MAPSGFSLAKKTHGLSSSKVSLRLLSGLLRCIQFFLSRRGGQKSMLYIFFQMW